jgi:HPr kinase/phosphorylase
VNRLSARDLFEDIKERKAHRWVAGKEGADRALQSGGAAKRRPSENGYLNII